MKNLSVHFLVSTFFGVGKISKAPGTMGSIAALPFFWLTLQYPYANNFEFLIASIAIVVFLSVIGTWATKKYMAETSTHDPKEVVIDEVVGQLVVLYPVYYLFFLYTHYFEVLAMGEANSIADVSDKLMVFSVVTIPLCFVIFRIFDIFKPWPIKWVDDNLRTNFSVVLDDLVAGTISVIVYLGILMLIFG